LSPSGAYEEAVERLAAAVQAAAEGEREWEGRLLAGLGAGLGFLAAEPDLARLLLVDSLSSRRLEHERSLTRLAAALRPPAEVAGDEPVSDEVLRLQAGGVVSYLSGRVLAGEAEALPEEHGALLRYLLAFSASPD
jgi:hypothetical protein